MKTWVYRGAVVMTRASPASPEVLRDIELRLEEHGFSHEDFCSPKYEQCTNLRVTS